MADRQRFCVIILSLMIIGSGCYLGYFIFIDQNKALIEKFNWVRLCIFFAQHIISLGMLIQLLKYQDNDNVIQWMFQLSTVIIVTFIGGQVFTAVRGGRVFGSSLFSYDNTVDYGKQDSVIEFELNQMTLYFQIMTDFIMFFIVSGIAMIVMKCRSVQQEERYQFMIDNLKSEDWVDEPNVQEKKTCAICLTDLDSERVLKVPCEHYFHKECLVNWLKRSTICPLCRTDIQQSLAPSSPQRFPTSQIPRSYPPPPVQIPSITLPNLLSNGAHSNRGDFTDRVVEQLSNGNSRVSIGRNVRNFQTERINRNNQVIQENNNLNRNSERRSITRSIQQQQNTRTLSSRTLNVESINEAASSIAPNSPRSIYLPAPQSQRNINVPVVELQGLKSQPLIKMSTGAQSSPQQISSIKVSREQPSQPVLKLYLNPNEKKLQQERMRIKRQNESRREMFDENRANQMGRIQFQFDIDERIKPLCNN